MSLRLSPKHGVNPSVGICFFCMKDKEVILFGQMKGDVQAPRQVCVNKDPCSECLAFMTQGVILISFDPKLSDAGPDDPHRTGGWVVVADKYVSRVFDKESSIEVLKKRVAFVDDETWAVLGLPKGELM